MFGRRKKSKNVEATEAQLEWMILWCGKFALDFPDIHGLQIQPGNLIYETKRIAEKQDLRLSDGTARIVASGAKCLTFGDGRQFLSELVGSRKNKPRFPHNRC